MPKISGNEQTDQINKGQSRETEENGRVYIRGLGSFLADAAAEGEWQIIREHFPQVKTHTVILKDIMDEILLLEGRRRQTSKEWNQGAGNAAPRRQKRKGSG
jgi:hypothetical protein